MKLQNYLKLLFIKKKNDEIFGIYFVNYKLLLNGRQTQTNRRRG